MNAALNMKQLQRKHYNLIVQDAVKDMKRSWKKKSVIKDMKSICKCMDDSGKIYFTIIT